jgi:hypothetical protein
MQAAFGPDQVKVVGRFSDYTRVSDEADRKAHVFHFCPDCGSQVFYTEPDEPDRIVVSEAGRYAEAADRGRELLQAHPHPALLYNIACCESLAGRTADALDHLGREMSERFRQLAKDDSDFDPIRRELAFAELVGRR